MNADYQDFDFIASARRVIDIEANATLALKDRINEQFLRACDLRCLASLHTLHWGCVYRCKRLCPGGGP